jgi:hypothetical protein
MHFCEKRRQKLKLTLNSKYFNRTISCQAGRIS